MCAGLAPLPWLGAPTESCLLVSQTSWALPAMFYRLICQISVARLFVGGALEDCWGGDALRSLGPCWHTHAQLSARAAELGVLNVLIVQPMTLPPW